MHIFISHSNSDEANVSLTRRLVAYLNAKGVFCWVDFYGLEGGRWAPQIAKARESAAAYIFVATRQSLSSPECSREIDGIVRKGRENLIVPFFADDAYFDDAEASSRFDYYLGSLEGVKLSGFAGEEDAFAAVLRLLPKQVVMPGANPSDFKMSADMTTLEKYVGHDASVTIPPVCTVGEMAFSGNGNLQKVILPDTVKKLSRFAFSGCGNLMFVEGGEGLESCAANVADVGVPAVRDVDGTRIFGNVALGCSDNRETLEVPEGVRVIADGAFKNCFELKSVKLPISVAAVGERAFKDCFALTKVTMPARIKVGEGAFANCPAEICTEDKEKKDE